MKISLVDQNDRLGSELSWLCGRLLSTIDGVSIRSVASCDVVFVHHKAVGKCNNIKKPIVIVDSFDSASVQSQDCREFLQRDNVIALLKNAILSPSELNNSKVIGNFSHHVGLLNGLHTTESLIEHPVQLSKKCQSKIQSCFWNLRVTPLRPRFGSFVKSFEPKLPNLAERDIDVCFIGQTNFKIKPLSWHRKQCILRLNALAKISSYKVIATSKKVPVKEYHQLLRRSKIVVSPWGYGEVCYRDWEAIMSGAILIKPRTDFIKESLFATRSVGCDLDFQDLDQQVKDVFWNPQSHILSVLENQKQIYEQLHNRELQTAGLKAVLKRI